MRGLILAALIMGWVPLMLFKPHVGVLVWDWVSHMVPQGQVFGFARTFPFLNFVAIATMAGLVLSREEKSIPSHPLLGLLVVYLLWVVITTVGAFEPSLAFVKLEKFIKVVLFAILAMIIMQSPNRLKAFIYVMGLSLAFIAVKGGLFTLVTGGSVGRVQGAGGMMTDNNQLAMALAMSAPLAYYFYQHPPIPKLKLPMLGLTGLFVLAVLGTQSRGGFATLAAVLGFWLIKSRHKFAMIALIVPIAIGGIAFMPDSWRERMGTIQTATDDSSFVGRVSMWRFSTNLADDNPVIGGGFDVFYVPRVQDLYMPPGFEPRAPHSIYFEVMAEHGYVGFVLFLTLITSGFFAAGHVARHFDAFEGGEWLADLGRMVQLGLVGYSVGGLTLNVATFDLFYHLLAIVVMTWTVGEKMRVKGELKVRPGQEVAADLPVKKWRPPPRPT